MEEPEVEEKRETVSEFLIRLMGEFSDDEPVDIVVAYVTNSTKTWCAHNDVEFCRAVTMLECAKSGLIRDREQEIEDEEDQEDD